VKLVVKVFFAVYQRKLMVLENTRYNRYIISLYSLPFKLWKTSKVDLKTYQTFDI